MGLYDLGHIQSDGSAFIGREGSTLLTRQTTFQQPEKSLCIVIAPDQVRDVYGIDVPRWVSDFTYVSTWQGFVYAAPRHWARTNGAFNGSKIETFANRLVGWKASRSAKTDFVLDALEQALYARRPTNQGGPIHHSDRGGQYLSIRYTERLAKAGIEPSVGSVGDAYDRASGRHWFKTTGEGFGRDHQRPLQNRGHPAAQFMENDGGGRAGNPQIGRLVQQPPPA